MPMTYPPQATAMLTIAALPAVAPATNAQHLVTNALSPVWGAVPVAGGSAVVPVYWDGALWRVG